MRSVAMLEASDVDALEGVVFDLDDTVLDHGALTQHAYSALFRLREAGLELVASTGRPAGWCEVIARQWPVTAAIAENGAVVWTRREDGTLALDDCVQPPERAERRQRIESIAGEVARRFPQLVRADDNAARISDLTFDIGERRRVGAAVVEEAVHVVRELGARTFVSSVHMHVTFDGFDKASGYARWAAARGRDPVRAFSRSAFIGDSANDAAAFARFRLTFAPSNVAPFLSRLTIPPRFIAARPMSLGFADIADAIVRARSAPA